MLRQAKNICKIEGILSEIDLSTREYMKDGKETHAIGGEIKIRTEQKINGETITLEIPVSMFATKYTNKGGENPAYKSIQDVMTNFKSIAAVGEAEADRVRITNGSIRMNEFYPKGSDRLVSKILISASFLNKVKPTEYKPQAMFEAEFVVAAKDFEVDKEGNETGRLKINTIIPQYGGKVDVVPMFTINENVASAVNDFWNNGDSVKAAGRLLFSSKTETTLIPVDFGEPEEKTTTINIAELLITGGSEEPLSGEFAFDTNEVQAALAQRKAHLEELKTAGESNTKKKATPAKSATIDLGF